MRKISFVLFIFLSISANLNAFESPFVSFADSYKKSPNDTIEITNMPPVRSQDSVGICYAFAAANLLDHRNCLRRKIDCKNIKDSERVSPLDLAKYSITPSASDKNFGTPQAYQKLPEGGAVYLTLRNLFDDELSVASESCAPFKAAVNKYGGSGEIEMKTWQMLKEKFNEIHDKKNDCVDCVVDEIHKYFPRLQSKNAIKEALNKTNYEEFLYKLLIPDYCKQDSNQIELERHLLVVSFPDKSLPAKTAKDELKNIMIEILKKGKPLSLTGICLDKKQMIPDLKDCAEYHAVTITGFTKMCDAKGTCHEAFKVQNSWGEEWQKQNSDGWVLASQLTERIGPARGSINFVMSYKTGH